MIFCLIVNFLKNGKKLFICVIQRTKIEISNVLEISNLSFKKKIEKQKREKGKTFFSTLFGNIKVNKNEICQISI